MSDIVQRLSEGDHPVEISIRPERTIAGLKECLDRGYVHVKFTGTRGGTELGVSIDRDRSRIDAANLDAATGVVTIAGELTLDYERVRCIADIELPSMQGRGRLERVEQGALLA